MKLRRVIGGAVIATAVSLSFVGVQTASAHHPLVSGTTQCRTGDTWSVNWSASADAVRGLTWRILEPSGYAPAGSQADSASFTRTASYPVTQASATETVKAKWSNGVQDSRSATVQRPEPCVVDTTTTTTTTTTTVAPTTTTTLPDTTTTTLPPAGSTTVPDAPTTTLMPDAPTTTAVAVGEPPVPPTTASSAVVATTVPVRSALPATGPSEVARNIVIAAMVCLIIGAVFYLASWKRKA